MANNKIMISTGETLLDLTGDTVTAGSLLAGTSAHDASGEAIEGSLKDGIEKYFSDVYIFSTPTNFKDYVINLGFVPNLFIMYYADTAIQSPEGYTRVLMCWYSKNVNTGTFLSEIYRGMYYYRSGSGVTAPRVSSYSDYNMRPYENGSIKGVIGYIGTSSSAYRLEGTYRVIAIKTTRDVI